MAVALKWAMSDNSIGQRRWLFLGTARRKIERE
jgi:hypothetical protein